MRESSSSEGTPHVSTSFRLLLPRPLHDDIIAQARAELPNECCGILAGHVITSDTGERLAQVLRRYPLVNAADSPATEYLSEARSMFDAVRDMDKYGLDLLAIYHSHPTSAPVPSNTDRESNYSPEVMNLIVSLAHAGPVIRAWWLTAEGHHEAAWEVVPNASVAT